MGMARLRALLSLKLFAIQSGDGIALKYCLSASLISEVMMAPCDSLRRWLLKLWVFMTCQMGIL